MANSDGQSVHIANVVFELGQMSRSPNDAIVSGGSQSVSQYDRRRRVQCGMSPTHVPATSA